MRDFNCFVICTDDNNYIRSVDGFQSEDEASLFISEQAAKIYERIDDDCPEKAIEVLPGYAKVSGEGFFEWKLGTIVSHIKQTDVNSTTHGKWILHDNGFISIDEDVLPTHFYLCDCSVCGYRTGTQAFDFDYCPKCGAAMEKVNKDNIE